MLDVLLGVFNLLIGEWDGLVKIFFEYNDVDVVWYFGFVVGSKVVYEKLVGNLKWIWVNFGRVRDWVLLSVGEGEVFLRWVI